MSIRPHLVLLLLLAATGCVGIAPPDPVGRWLDAGEVVRLRMPAQLLHGHDMQETSYESPEGYQPVPTYQGELLVTDRRLLFVDQSSASDSSRLSVPYTAVTRARPSQTPLLHYLVIWDSEGHADSFVVDSRNVRALHQLVGQQLLKRMPAAQIPTDHSIKAGK